jgi:DNA-directed RNA polymerase specialized sigma24 family protein
VDLTQRSDDELIQIFCQAHPLHGGNEAFTTLWQRHAPFVDGLVQRLTNRLPHGHDRPTFVEEARQRVRINLLRRLPRYQGPDVFRAYLARVVRSATLDQSRAVQGRLMHEAPAGDVRQIEAADTAPSVVHDDLPFRSRYALLDPFNFVADRQRQHVINLALDLHGQQSHQGTRSTRALRWRYWDDHSIADLAGRLQVHDRTIYRLLSDDLTALRLVLKDRFGITHIGRIHEFGDKVKPNNASKRPLTQASLRCKR